MLQRREFNPFAPGDFDWGSDALLLRPTKRLFGPVPSIFEE